MPIVSGGISESTLITGGLGGLAFFVLGVPFGVSFADPVAGPAAQAGDPLGSGIIRPFRRTERADFANGSGAPLVLSCVGQVLGTSKGKLPFAPDFGSDLPKLRHKGNDPTVAAVARVYVDDALSKWEPRAQVVDVSKERATDTSGASEVRLKIQVKVGSAIAGRPSRL